MALRSGTQFLKSNTTVRWLFVRVWQTSEVPMPINKTATELFMNAHFFIAFKG
jgi:hypothetical protein